VLIWVNGPEGCEFVNRTYCRFLGVDLEKVLGYEWAEYVHADDRDAYVGAFQKAEQERATFDAEFRFRRHDGEYRWMRSVGQPRFGPDGEFLGYVGSTIDISDAKRAQEDLSRSQQELADFFDNATVGLHWVGPDGIIQRVNQAELDLLGYEHDEYVGHHISEFHVDRSVIDDILTRLTNGQTLRECPSQLRCKDGSIRDVLISSSVLFEDGQFIHTRCFTIDVTVQKRVEAALKESESRFRAMAVAGPSLFWIADSDGTITYANHRW
jgi:PAS domain S-box-containing protein